MSLLFYDFGLKYQKDIYKPFPDNTKGLVLRMQSSAFAQISIYVVMLLVAIACCIQDCQKIDDDAYVRFVDLEKIKISDLEA